MLYCGERDYSVHISFNVGDTGLLTGKHHLPKELQFLREFMNQCLQDWHEYVAEKRSRCYQLNYYTTEQLVLLRHQLAEFLKNRATLPSQILVLLSAAKSNCTKDDVHVAMKAAARDNRFGIIDEDVAAEQAEAAKREKSSKIVELLMQEYGMQEQTSWAAIQELGCDEDMQVTDYMEWCVTNAENENRIEELTSGMQWERYGAG